MVPAYTVWMLTSLFLRHLADFFIGNPYVLITLVYLGMHAFLNGVLTGLCNYLSLSVVFKDLSYHLKIFVLFKTFNTVVYALLAGLWQTNAMIDISWLNPVMCNVLMNGRLESSPPFWHFNEYRFFQVIISTNIDAPWCMENKIAYAINFHNQAVQTGILSRC